MSALLGLLLNPRVLGFLAAAGLVTFAVLHYTGLRSDLATAIEDVAAARASAEIAIGAAEGNADALARAQAEHRRTLEVIADLEEELADWRDVSTEAEAEIHQAAPEDNPPVPGVLETLRQRRFGGQ